MAEEVALAGTEARAKLRNPLGVVGLSIITIGIYYIFWWYFINREMRDFGRARGTDLGQNPGNSVLAITLGALIIVPAIVTPVDHARPDPAHAGDRRRRAPGERADHLHPAAADRAGGHLVRPERAQQGLDRAGRGRVCGEPASKRSQHSARPAAAPRAGSVGAGGAGPGAAGAGLASPAAPLPAAPSARHRSRGSARAVRRETRR